MIKKPNYLELELYFFLKNAIRRFTSSRAPFSLILFFVLSTTASAQTIVDYNLPENWMCHPVLKSTDIARQQNLALTVIDSNGLVNTVIDYKQYADTLVDIFYVYPTIDISINAKGTFSPPANTLMDCIDTATAEYIYSEQVGIYAQLGRVFAPYYRQANLSVFLDPGTDTMTQLLVANCMDTAYNNIDSAFSNYLKYYNNGRKIILMGHSQGADLVMFLLRKKFDNNPTLRSQLVVALCAGEPNYVSANNDSRTGGVLQNIKACNPDDPEPGCIMNWRTWNADMNVKGLDGNSFFFNPYFVTKGLIYQCYDTINYSHKDANYNFGYTTTPKPIARYISLGNSYADYVGFDNMFTAKVYSNDTVPGSTHLLIKTDTAPNDQRIINAFPATLNSALQSKIPLPSKDSYHIWDWQFVQNDVLKLLPNLIAKCNPMLNAIQEVNFNEQEIHIYPNPTTGIVHIDSYDQKIISIKLYNYRGVFIEELFKSDFSVLKLSAGIYLIKVQTENSAFINKLIKQ